MPWLFPIASMKHPLIFYSVTLDTSRYYCFHFGPFCGYDGALFRDDGVEVALDR